MDNASSRVERARADYDQTHAFKLNHYMSVPLGPGHRLNSGNRFVNRIIEGWARTGMKPTPYQAGSWGPAGAFALTERNGHSWYE